MSLDLSGQEHERHEEVDAKEPYITETLTSFVEQMEALNLSLISTHSTTIHEQESDQKIQLAQAAEDSLIDDGPPPDSMDTMNFVKPPEQTPEPTITIHTAAKPNTKTAEATLSFNATIPPLQMGDHVYRRCTYGVIPFQHHAIVLNIWKVDLEQEGDECAWMLKVFDFSRHPEDVQAIPPDSPRVILTSPQKKRRDGLRVYESPAQLWQKVIYGAPMQQHLFSSSGTCTAANSDAPGLIRARVQFLLEHATDETESPGNGGSQTPLLPPYAWLYANSECVAVWCKTGTWATMQAASWLTWTALGQVKSAATIAGVAAATQVTLPAAGLWGWLGYTTQASLLTVQPALAPAIAAYGVVTVGIPYFLLAPITSSVAKHNHSAECSLWDAAVDDPELFVDGITHWSE